MRTFLCLAAAGLLTFASPVLAQQKSGKSATERANHRTEMMTRELGLSADQTAKVQEINTQFAAQLDELRPSETERTAKRERRSQAQQARASYDERLKAVLTPQQYTTYQERQQKRKEEAKARRMERGQGAGHKRMKPLPTAQPAQE